MHERAVATFVALLAGALAIVACGSERVFSAQEFIDEMNEQGAALALGEGLTENPEGARIYAVELTDAAPSAVGQQAPPPNANSNATLLVAADSDAGRDEFERCEQAPILTCFRAANAVLRVEDLPSADRARLTVALEALASSDG